MKIIIVGSGKVGYAIARQLAQEKHDITMVDNEIAHLSRADSTLDVMCVHGSGASISVLMDAGARTADLVIAVTGADDTNMVCCLLAKSLESRLQEREITLTLTDAAIDKIADAGFDPVYGARPLKRYMQSHLETMLAKAIIAGDVLPGQNVTVDVNADGELEVRK